MVVELKETIGHIENLRQFLPEKSREELSQILEYGEKIKVEGERKKKERWSNHSREEFMKLLRYKWNNKEEIEGNYQYLDAIKGLEREKFIEEYLQEDMLYSGELDETEPQVKILCSYEDWKEGNVVMKEGVNLSFYNRNIGPGGVKVIAENLKLKNGVHLDLSQNQIGAEGAEAISKMKLKEGVILNLAGNEIGYGGAKVIAEKMKLKEGMGLYLGGNEIGAEGAKIIAEKMKLKEGVELDLRNNGIGAEGAKDIVEKMELKKGVTLNLSENQIGDEGVKAIIENMKLEEGVTLDLSGNDIGDEGAEAIIEGLKLKEGVTLSLRRNLISENMKYKLEEWNEEWKKKGINCKIDLVFY